MSEFEKLLRLDGLAQADLVRRGEVSALELTEAAIARIERIDGGINAVVTRAFERALDAAVGLLPEGPFTGVPFLLKDVLSSWEGVRMTCGSRLAHAVAGTCDSELIRRLGGAGLVMLGKTNTSELGLLPNCEPVRFGATCNPWGAGYSTGGSSGGSAAAVATAMVGLAHASDGGGSIRIPASCCGLFGLKPTRGRNPMGPEVGEVLGGLVVEHALTRSVRDSAALLDATAGADTGAPYFASPPNRRFVEALTQPLRPLRIGFSLRSPTGDRLHPECEAAVKEAARLCETLGHSVDEAAPEYDHEQAVEIFIGLWSAGCASLVTAIAQRSGRRPEPGLLEPTTRALYERGCGLSAVDYLACLHGMHRLGRRIAGWFESQDLLLTSTLSTLPPRLGHFDSRPEQPLGALTRAGHLVPTTPLANMTGQPAMSVPLHWSRSGLPVGTHFMGRYGEEFSLFALAAQLEQASPWQQRWPPMAD